MISFNFNVYMIYVHFCLLNLFSFQHCANSGGITRPIILVTASVDKILLKKPILVDVDLSINGAVTWVGRSSMEMQLQVLQHSQGILSVKISVIWCL